MHFFQTGIRADAVDFYIDPSSSRLVEPIAQLTKGPISALNAGPKRPFPLAKHEEIVR